MLKNVLTSSKLPRYLLQIGIAFVFLYAGLAAFLKPDNWVGYLPKIFENIVPVYTQLKLFSAGEIILALWILSGWQLFWAALLAALGFLSITLVDLSLLDITFRDVGLFFAALALAALAWRDNSK